MQTGENWDYVMTDCMILENCMEVSKTINITKSDGTIIFYWSGTFLDPVSDADTLSYIPQDAILNRCSPAPAVAAVYFELYMLVCVYFVVQLVIAVLIDIIETLEEIEAMPVSQKHIEVCRQSHF